MYQPKTAIFAHHLVIMKLCRIILVLFLSNILCGHSQTCKDSFPIISWGGIAADKADTLYSLAKECGFNTHLGLYSTQQNAVLSMDAAHRAQLGIIISFPQIKDSTESAIASIKDHPALVAYHIKDEPELCDFPWLKDLYDKIYFLDSKHPCYINLLPNWLWGVEEYCNNLELYATKFDAPFYSFDNYPVIEKNGKVTVRPDWYRNLEEFSAMARRHGKPFWAFALAKAHSITVPQVAVYPEPTIGHLRLQVFSNLLYGAQAIQYFNFTGIVDPATCEKKPAFDLVRQVNSEVRVYSSVFTGCTVLGVWHIGETIPCGTSRLETMPHKSMKSIEIHPESIAGDISKLMSDETPGAVVSLIENAGETYLAIQNRSCLEDVTIDITFSRGVSHITLAGPVRFNGQPLILEPGNIAIFQL